MPPSSWRLFLFLSLLLHLGTLAQFPPVPSTIPCNTYSFNVTMSDGVVLSSILYTLNTTVLGDHNIAVQYQTFPYTAEAEKTFAFTWTQDPLLKLQHGHGLLLQHVRGTRPGTGQFRGFHAVEDVKDSVAWLKTQPWWNGVLFGAGYSAMGSASYMSVLVGVNFTAQAISIAAGDEYHFVYQNGAYRYQFINGMLQFVQQPQYNMTYLQHEGPDDFWVNTNIQGHFDRVQWPAVHTAGWYDVFQRDTLLAYDGYHTQAHPSVRDLQFLVIWPGGHCFQGGQINWGNSTQQALQLISTLLEDLIFGIMQDAGTETKFVWRLAVLKGIAKLIPRVFWYVLGPGLPGSKGNWITAANELPTPTVTPFYLNSGGSLSRGQATEVTTSHFLYNPRDPLPNWGGCNMGNPPGAHIFAAYPCGPWDQVHVYKGQKDVLMFDSDPLPAAMAITGAINAVLYVSTNATDTDFVVKLVDVFPNGTRMLVADGIQRMRWRKLRQGPKPVKPGLVYRIDVDLWSISYIFPSGHRVGVDISSSNFPRFDVNPNTGLSLVESYAKGDSVWALNAVHMGPTWSSHIRLPIVPMSAVAPLGPRVLEDLLKYLHGAKSSRLI